MRRLLLGLVLSLGAGLAMGAAIYDAHLPILTLTAWVPAVISQHALWPHRWRGLAMGLTWFAYLAVAFAPKLTPELGAWAWALPIGIGLLVTLIDQATVDKAQQTSYRLFWWQQACAFTAVEVGRSFIPAVATWTMAGYGLTLAPGWRLLAGWVGITGLSLAVWACNFCLAYLALVLLKRAPWRPIAGPVAAAVPVLCLLLTLLPWPTGPATAQALRVAAIQPGFDLYEGTWNDRRLHGDPLELSRDLLPIGAAQTRAAAAAGARLIVWPEGFLRVVPQDDPELKRSLEALARGSGAALAVGYLIETPDGRRNEVALISPAGEWAITAKHHPVPWAETGSVTKGQAVVITVDGVRIGAMICYDADFADTARSRAGTGVQLLAVPAHDWPAIGGARAIHVRARAAENRIPMVLADWRVGSVIIDGQGNVVAHMPQAEAKPGFILADAGLAPASMTPYGRLGDLAGWAAVLGFIVAMGWEAVLRRSITSAPPSSPV